MLQPKAEGHVQTPFRVQYCGDWVGTHIVGAAGDIIPRVVHSQPTYTTYSGDLILNAARGFG